VGRAKTAEDQIGAIFEAHGHRDPKVVRNAMVNAARTGRPLVVRATPAGVTNQARLSWKVFPTEDGADLSNTAPHSGILEQGSRPHYPPLRPILHWVVGKWGIDLQGGKRSFETIEEVPWKTYRAAKTVQEKIAAEGTEAHRMVGDNLSELNRLARLETDRALQAAGSVDTPF